MRRLWNRLNHKLRHQVYLRVLPVVALSVLLVGTVGWVVFARNATAHRAGSLAHDLHDLKDRLIVEVVKETLSSQAGQDLTVESDLVWATVCVGQDSEGQPRLLGHRGHELPSSVAPLADWVTANRRFLARDYRPGSWEGVRPAATPWLADNHPLNPILIFPAHLEQGRSLVPVLVRCDAGSEDGHTVYFFDLERLLAVKHSQPERWLCLLDGSGRVVYTSGGEPLTGKVLGDMARWPGHPVLGKVDGRQLMAAGQDDSGAGRVGRGLVPWLVQRSDFPELGLGILAVDQVSSLRRAVVGYLWAILLAAGLALAGAVLGINRVMHHTSSQLTALARNMEALARGDYSGRMHQIRKDEVGSLIGYFNLMAVSLDEAHRQVKEKAAHLRAALENMRMLDKAKDDFMVLISHEVRTPLTSIMGGVDYLMKSVEKVSGPEREILDRVNVAEVAGIIHSSGERLAGFMTDAIQMTSMGSAEARLELQAVPVQEMIDQGLVGVAELAAQGNISIHNQLQDEQEWKLLCDPGVLTVGFQKILKNSVVHNREGGVVIIREAMTVPGEGTIAELITTETLRRLEGQPAYRDFEDEELSWRLVEVFNTGQPIPEGRRAALFGKFELVGRIENHQKGSGLSLPIAKAAVESHGGRILLHSDGRDGNSFFLMLPTVTILGRGGRAEEPVLGYDAGQGVGGVSWDEEVSQVGNTATLEVELNDLCSSILGGVDQAGGGVDGPGGAHHEEEVTVTRGLE